MKISQPKKSHKKLIIAIVSVLLLAGIGTATFFILNKDNSSSNKETNTEVATNTDVASNTDVALNDTTETTETVEEPSEEPSVETPSENKPSETPSTTETPNTTPSENKPSETPSTPSTTETPSQPTTSEPTTTETTSEPTPQPTPNVEKHWCGTPMQMMSGYIFHPAEGYYAQAIRFSNGEIFAPFNGDYNWVDEYMHNNGILSFSVADNYFIETTPEWREENVTQMCCPSCRYADNGFVAY